MRLADRFANRSTHRTRRLCHGMAVSSFVVAICYPTIWFTEPGGLDHAIAELEAIDPSIEVVLAPYEETPDRRAARGAGDEDWAASQPPLDAELVDVLKRANAILALDIPVDLANLAPNLQLLQAFGAGADQFRSCTQPDGLAITSSSGSNAPGIAEFALGRILEHYKRFRAIADCQRSHTWQPLFGDELRGKTLGLIGFGAINSELARRARAFDMEVHATRQSAQPGDTDPRVDRLYPAAELFDMLAVSNAVVAAVPNTPTTQGLMNAEAFAAMAPGGFFCNVGRGSLVDESALLESIRSGHLAAAALDVTSTEPLADDHPLWDEPKVALSFHNAAVPTAMFGATHAFFADNVGRHLRGEALRNPVSFETG